MDDAHFEDFTARWDSRPCVSAVCVCPVSMCLRCPCVSAVRVCPLCVCPVSMCLRCPCVSGVRVCMCVSMSVIAGNWPLDLNDAFSVCMTVVQHVDHTFLR